MSKISRLNAYIRWEIVQDILKPSLEKLHELKRNNMMAEWNSYLRELDDLQNEIENILKLPVKQIVEKFPDIAKHIPEKEDIKDKNNVKLVRIFKHN
jgi:hypothetical protein